jgi:hypothetical protein
MDMPEITEKQARDHAFQKGRDDADVLEIMTKTLGEVPTRVIIVEEMQALGLITKKRARKRIQEILDTPVPNGDNG